MATITEKRMKSIKEKAAEYRRVIKIINEHESIVDTQGSEIFEAGANYVLEKVECCLNRISVDNHSDDDLEDLYDTLCEMVKNLKEE